MREERTVVMRTNGQDSVICLGADGGREGEVPRSWYFRIDRNRKWGVTLRGDVSGKG